LTITELDDEMNTPGHHGRFVSALRHQDWRAQLCFELTTIGLGVAEISVVAGCVACLPAEVRKDTGLV
jgi:hypothetical protein